MGDSSSARIGAPLGGGRNHAILADIVFLLVTPESAFAGSFTYQMEDTFGQETTGGLLSLRKRAMQRIYECVQKELQDFLSRDRTVRNYGLTHPQIYSLAKALIQTEIVQEKWDRKGYYLKARITADPTGGTTLKSCSDALKVWFRRFAPAVLTEPAYVPQTLSEGLSLLRDGDFDGSIAVYDHLIKRDPSCLEAYLNRGVAFFRKNDYEKALNDFDHVLRLDAENVRAYINRAGVFAEQGKLGLALKDYDHALTADKHSTEAHMNRGVVLLKRFSNAAAAIGDFESVIELAPRDPRGYLCRGLCLARQGLFPDAIDDFSKAIQFDGAIAAVYYNRGNAFMRLGKLRRAVKDYTDAIGRRPQYVAAYFNRAIAYGKLTELEKALKDCDHVIHLDSEDAKAYFYRGLIHFRLDQESEAYRDWEVAARLGEYRALNYLKDFRFEKIPAAN
jgi:tetratricopeptide (TPR) repeat protein